MDFLFNLIGLMGMFLLLSSYFLLQRGTLASDDPRYLWLNLVSAVALVISLLRFWNLASFIVECAWIAISIQGLLRVRRRRHE